MWRTQPNVFVPSAAHAKSNSRASSSARQGSAEYTSESQLDGMGRTNRAEPLVEDEVEALRNSLEVKERELIGCRSEMARQRGENEQLRRRIEAHAVREAFLTSQFEHALRQREINNSQLTPDQQRDLINLNESLTKENRSLHRSVADKESELVSLRTQIHDMRGKLQAYNDVWMHRESPTRFTKDTVERAESKSANGSQGVAVEMVHAMLSDTLSGIGFIKRALVAVQHCEQAGHDGVECRRSKPECVVKCLRAALAGNTESQQESRCRTYGVPADTVALTVRQEVGQCETLIIKLAAHFLAHQSTRIDVPPHKATSNERISRQRKEGSRRAQSPDNREPRIITARDENQAKSDSKDCHAPSCSPPSQSNDQRQVPEVTHPAHSQQGVYVCSDSDKSKGDAADGEHAVPPTSAPLVSALRISKDQAADSPLFPEPLKHVTEIGDHTPPVKTKTQRTPDARSARRGPLHGKAEEESDTKECDVQ